VPCPGGSRPVPCLHVPRLCGWLMGLNNVHSFILVASILWTCGLHVVDILAGSSRAQATPADHWLFCSSGSYRSLCFGPDILSVE